MARTPRSLFFSYARGGNPLSAAKEKGTDIATGWKLGDQTGNVTELKCPKALGTSPIKFTATALARALAPDLKALPIPEPRFVRFLRKEGAEEDSWTMRFWEVNDEEGWSRAITAGKETPDLWTAIVTAMNARTRRGGRSAWSGVEFTHPALQARVILHRWPTASIAPWGESSAYEEMKDRFLKLLKEIV
jgi:hypothetical protein